MRTDRVVEEQRYPGLAYYDMITVHVVKQQTSTKVCFNYLYIAYCSREWRTDLVPRVCLNRLEKRGYHVTSMTGVGQTCIWTLFRPLSEEEKQTSAPSIQENGKAMECTDGTNSNGDMSDQASGCSR